MAINVNSTRMFEGKASESDTDRKTPFAGGRNAEHIATGISITPKIAIGRLKFLKRYGRADNKGFAPHKYLGAIAEKERFYRAANSARSELETVIRRTAETVGSSEAEIFLIHKMLLDDEEFIEKITGLIADGSTAENAIDRTVEEYEKMFGDLNDAYLSARIADLRDVAGRLKRILCGNGTIAARDNAENTVSGENSGYIIVADDLSPSETVLLDTSEVIGFVTFEGSSNSHTAILARSMGIPAIIGTGRIEDSYDGKNAVIDGKTGTLYIEPTKELVDGVQREIDTENSMRQRLEAYRGLESITRSGKKIRLYANIGSVADAKASVGSDAEGIGLLRSEFLYLGRSSLPDEEEQFRAYRAIAETLRGRPVIIRTLDIGADKKTDTITMEDEENPALGLRGIRLCFEYPEIFRTQLSAICRASAYGNISVMLPMIVSESEVANTKRLISEIQDGLAAKGIPYDRNMKIGIMIETPAAAVMADELAAVSDFFSVGTNDLCQYTLAADRQNKSVGYVCNDIEPVLRLIAFAAKGAHRHGIWIGVCGELAADTSLTERFIEMGIDELSVAAPYILTLREKIRSCK